MKPIGAETVDCLRSFFSLSRHILNSMGMTQWQMAVLTDLLPDEPPFCFSPWEAVIHPIL